MGVSSLRLLDIHCPTIFPRGKELKEVPFCLYPKKTPFFPYPASKSVCLSSFHCYVRGPSGTTSCMTKDGWPSFDGIIPDGRVLCCPRYVGVIIIVQRTKVADRVIPKVISKLSITTENIMKRIFAAFSFFPNYLLSFLQQTSKLIVCSFQASFLRMSD